VFIIVLISKRWRPRGWTAMIYPDLEPEDITEALRYATLRGIKKQK